MSLPLTDRIQTHGRSAAIIDQSGAHSYEALDCLSSAIAAGLLRTRQDLEERRIALLVSPGHAFAGALLGIWKAGGIAVPLCTTHPARELQHVLADSGASTVVVDAANESLGRSVAKRVHNLGDLRQASIVTLPRIDSTRRAQMLYTSGTTGRPKGAVATHANVEAMVRPLIDAWEWRSTDRILHALPLHHAHGLVNALLCCLWAGATCTMLPRFNAAKVWDALEPATLFMGVPTMYAKLLQAWKAAPAGVRTRWAEAAASCRLMVSGSAALPQSLFEEWEQVTGHRLLERYGLTETGMVLSNPLHGERRAGTVGQPLPGIAVCVAQSDDKEASGELLVKGASVFTEYWGHPDLTEEAFSGGWFKTGDIVREEDGYYRILGRQSVDMIKTGGFKVSALEVEEALRRHEAIADCAVVGLADEVWGARVCAGVVLGAGEDVKGDALRQWAEARLAPYKVPTRWLLMSELPRNAMGKVHKPTLVKLFARGEAHITTRFR